MLNHWILLENSLSIKKSKILSNLWSANCTTYAFKVEFSHLNKHKFKLDFKDTLNPICTCGAEVETIE